MLCGFILNLVLNQILRFIYVLENKKRDRMLEGKTEEEVKEMQREGEVLGFEDVTDKANVSLPVVWSRSLSDLLTLCSPCSGMFSEQGPKTRH